MGLNEGDLASEPIPSYEESVQPIDSKKSPSVRPQTLASRLASVQRKRVRSLVETCIDPLLDNHAESGLFKAAFALILSDVSLLQHRPGSEAAIDTLLRFPDDVYTSIVRLEGEENSSRFWHQQPVIRDLERELRERLGIAAEDITLAETSKIPGAQPPEPERDASVKWSSFGKLRRSKATQPPQIPMFTQANAGWREENKFPSDAARTSLHVTNEEVFVRVQTDLGLYQTRGCSAIVIRLQVGR